MMKKTLFALLALVPVAIAAEATPTFSATWSATADPVLTGFDWGSNFGYTAGNDYATIGGNNNPWKTGLTGYESFTLSFDIKGLTANNANWNSIVCLYSNGTTSGNANSLQLQFDTSGTLHLYNKVGGTAGYGGSDANGLTFTLTSADLQQDVWRNFTIVSDMTQKALTVYIDGVVAGAIEDWNPASPALTGLQFATAFGYGGHSLNGTAQVNNIKLYDTAVHPVSDTPAVPEPTTATLSLLALAGLAARRRRK